MTRSSKHTLKFSNSNKLDKLREFIQEYQRVGNLILTQIWENGYQEFNVKQDKLNFPKYIDYNLFNFETTLSARALSSLVTQISSSIRSSVAKRKKMLYAVTKNPKLAKNLNKNKYKCFKPDFSNANPELSSKCINLQTGIFFNYFVSLKSLGKSFGKINLPIKATQVSNKWRTRGKLLNGISVSGNSLILRFDIETKPKTEGLVVGIDQGMKTVATLSDSQATPEKDCHNHSLESIMYKLARKKKGSKAFERAQAHRKNFIHWSINQLNFSEIGEVRLEKIWNITYKKRSSRLMKHWTNTLIRDKIIRTCEEQEVPCTLQDSTYRSQRCFSCGSVRKANRKGKQYKCKNCGYEADADYNASLNHSIDLPFIDWTFRKLRLNLAEGFFWKPSGIFDVSGQELRVPDSADIKVN